MLFQRIDRAVISCKIDVNVLNQNTIVNIESRVQFVVGVSVNLYISVMLFIVRNYLKSMLADVY